MAEPKYFENFPVTTIEIRGVKRTIRDITRSVVVNQDFFDDKYAFYDYTIGDAERPDHVAFSQYGSTSIAWIILVTNKIYDLWRQWPLSDRILNDFIVSKYGSISNASSIVHEYRTVQDNIVVDEFTKNSLPSDAVRTITKLDFERELNERKRFIRLVQPQFIPELKKEIEELFEE